MKKLFVSLLCVVMMVTFMPSMAFADGETSPVSEVGTVEDLNAALKAEGEINLKLTGPIEGTVVIPAGKTVKLDLNGQTVKAENNAIEVVDGASLTITDTSGTGLVEGGFCGVYVEGNPENLTKFKLESGKIVGYYYGVSGNGSFDGTEITIAGGSVEGTCDSDNLGIYHPQAGTLNIIGGHVEGYTGIQICDGTLNMIDGTVVGNKPEKADKPYKDPNESDGSIMDGSAISVVSRGGGYGDSIEINISGGEIISANKGNEAVNSYSWKKGADGFEVNPDDIKDVAEGSITGGTFSSVPAEKFFDEEFIPVINKDGGCSVYTKEYAESNFVQDDDGNYFESNEAAGVKHTAVVVTEDRQKFYDDLAEAVAEAENGTVTLLKDVTLDEPLVISKSITLAGNHSITGAEDAARVILVDGEDIDVTLVDIEIVNGGGKHGLLVQNGSVTANGVSIDNSKTTGGAPVIVNKETTAIFNDLNLTLGENSWYGVNVDGATATFADVTVTDETLQPTQSVICAEGAEPKVTGSDLTAVTTEVDGGESQRQIAYVADQNLSQFVAAKKDKNVSKIELNSDVELTAPLVISEEMEIVGNNHAIKGTAALGKENVVTVMANGVTLSGITIETDVANKSGLHIYKTTDTELTDVKVIVKGSGAGILVNGAEVTVNGKLDFVLGENSWGGINVEVQDGDIPKVTFNDGSKVTVDGDKPAIYQDEENVSEGKAVINGAEDAGLKQNADGSYEVEDTTSGGGGGIIIPPAAQKPTIEADDHAKVTLGSDGTTATITVDEGYELADVVLNGVSQGKITFVYGLKTGDVLKVTTVKKGETEAEKNARLIKGVQNTTIRMYYKAGEIGKGWIKVRYKKSYGYKVDNYEIFRSTKKNTNFGKTPYFVTKKNNISGFYKNTKNVKKGVRHYYKMRGVREIAGETYYTQWSNLVMRTGR